MADLTFNDAVEVVRLAQRVSQLGGANMTDYDVTYYVARATPADRKAMLLKALHFSKEDRAVWDALNRIAQWHLRSGGPMPRELVDWVADRLEGKRERPVKPGPHAQTVRDKLIASVVHALVVDRGFHATRNKRLPMKMARARASVEGGSACDAVGVALGMGYKAVERVWTNSKPSDRELLRGSLNGLFASYEMQRNK